MSTGLGEIVLYRAADGGPALDVRLERESVWLSLNQLADLFGRDKSVISRHLRNVFKEGELMRTEVVAKNATTASDGKIYQVEYFNLDAIISVGYRVNSLRGTQFRIWATNVLRQHLVQGYTVHARRLSELNQAVRLIADVAHRRTLSGDEATTLLEVVADYAYALEVLDDYDYQRVRLGDVSPGPVAALALDEARQVIVRMGERFGATGLFGREKDEGLEGSLSAVCRLSAGRRSIPAWKKRRRTCCTSWSRTTTSSTATSALRRRCSCGFCRRTWRSTAPTAASASPTMPWWR